MLRHSGALSEISSSLSLFLGVALTVQKCNFLIVLKVLRRGGGAKKTTPP